MINYDKINDRFYIEIKYSRRGTFKIGSFYHKKNAIESLKKVNENLTEYLEALDG